MKDKIINQKDSNVAKVFAKLAFTMLENETDNCSLTFNFNDNRVKFNIEIESIEKIGEEDDK